MENKERCFIGRKKTQNSKSNFAVNFPIIAVSLQGKVEFGSRRLQPALTDAVALMLISHNND